jgi:hypothetical protein
MLTQGRRDLFGYEVVEGRQVVAAFDGGEVTSDAGARLLGATDRAIHGVARFTACFVDGLAQAGRAHHRGHGGAARLWASEARNWIAPIRSSTSPRRPSGMREAVLARHSALAKHGSIIDVRRKVGPRLLTRM